MLVVVFVIFNMIRNLPPYLQCLLAQGRRQVSPFWFSPVVLQLIPQGPAPRCALSPSALAARCCLAHDCCYEKLKQLGCQPVLNTYQFHLVNGTVACE